MKNYTLPVEIWLHIFSYLNKSKINLCMTNKNFLNLLPFLNYKRDFVDFAAKKGYLDVVKYLVNNKSNKKVIENIGPVYIQKIFYTSCNHGHLNLVSFLFNNGVDINKYQPFAFYRVFQKGYLDVLIFLIKNGFDMTCDNNYAIKTIIKNNHLDIIKYLISDRPDILDSTYIYEIALQNNQQKILEYLNDKIKIIGKNNITWKYYSLFNTLHKIKIYIINIFPQFYSKYIVGIFKYLFNKLNL